MSKTIEFYFDVGSPASYLAWTQLDALAQRTGARVELKPILLGGVFMATGNSSPATVPAKGNYSRIDMQRYANRYGVTLNQNPFFPINTLQLMRGAMAYQGTADFERYLTTVFNAMWIDELDMGQPEVVGKVLAKGGFDPAEVMAKASDPAVKEQLKKATEEAVSRGVFGAPTFFVGDDMFFGQDRLEWVEAAASN
ncbi:2-hydroxychromene-2-carboxylate isomerase [Pseudomonas neustonica]|uniref:2-hydroxychromene-2-carboxylate isomerase n=1 Tax=Pseudomonas neustonica TaxID=2487346 RepID=A0ABX9XD97_9PSED|nr:MULTISPECIES: 2-hydroxychromene-2-carboxylate isomerase [Pseudomonas]ROZ80020.1 2-hydroxychromene-2-carboxylate isomerase [Pseudomonas sp. SSM44]ROZ80656.1 2-hydroxychromene-2-carboxylate isomerase [Pseudomonas neustonica]